MQAIETGFASHDERSTQLWYVSDGTSVVGPVSTSLLLRGVTHGRIDESHWVRAASWANWRMLDQVREIAALRRTPAWDDIDEKASRPWADVPAAVEVMGVLRGARDEGEALFLAMHLAVARTHAEVALVHRVREPFLGYVTSAAYGPGAENMLGEVLRSEDVTLVVARAGASVVGAPSAGPVQRAAGRRLGWAIDGLRDVAMVPFVLGDELVAVMELGRADHPFRRHDVVALEEVAAAAVDRIEAMLVG